MHRCIMQRRYGKFRGIVDHKNRKPLDNRRGNLRFATHPQNHANTEAPRNNKTGHKGVSLDSRTGLYFADLQFNGKRYRLGRFPTIEAASNAYRRLARHLAGEFAA
jgi:hypothetical protein